MFGRFRLEAKASVSDTEFYPMVYKLETQREAQLSLGILSVLEGIRNPFIHNETERNSAFDIQRERL